MKTIRLTVVLDLNPHMDKCSDDYLTGLGHSAITLIESLFTGDPTFANIDGDVTGILNEGVTI